MAYAIVALFEGFLCLYLFGNGAAWFWALRRTPLSKNSRTAVYYSIGIAAWILGALATWNWIGLYTNANTPIISLPGFEISAHPFCFYVVWSLIYHGFLRWLTHVFERKSKS
jgi:hypothetical protein